MPHYQKGVEPRSIRKALLITPALDKAIRLAAELARKSVNDYLNELLERELMGEGK
jgi:hypothetical protein